MNWVINLLVKEIHWSSKLLRILAFGSLKLLKLTKTNFSSETHRKLFQSMKTFSFVSDNSITSVDFTKYSFHYFIEINWTFWNSNMPFQVSKNLLRLIGLHPDKISQKHQKNLLMLLFVVMIVSICIKVCNLLLGSHC